MNRQMGSGGMYEWVGVWSQEFRSLNGQMGRMSEWMGALLHS